MAKVAGKALENIAYVMIVMAIAWLFFSFIDVNASNMDKCEYASWNAYKVFTEVFGK